VVTNVLDETATSIVSVNECRNSGHNLNSHNSENPALQNAIIWGGAMIYAITKEL
jgi:hypothetical protein